MKKELIKEGIIKFAVPLVGLEILSHIIPTVLVTIFIVVALVFLAKLLKVLLEQDKQKAMLNAEAAAYEALADAQAPKKGRKYEKV